MDHRARRNFKLPKDCGPTLPYSFRGTRRRGISHVTLHITPSPCIYFLVQVQCISFTQLAFPLSRPNAAAQQSMTGARNYLFTRLPTDWYIGVVGLVSFARDGLW